MRNGREAPLALARISAGIGGVITDFRVSGLP